ncbi:MAG: ROK family protein [Methylococcales bacterium]|nr:ROK family protein [Methylococcaceae bacterium]
MRIGIDLGGTKIELVALDFNGLTLFKQRIATPPNSYPDTLKAIACLVDECEQELGVSGSVGVGHPGVISPDTGVVKNANSVCLNGKPLKEDLESHLNRTVRLANDANCFALSEYSDGAGVNCNSLFGVILGTGVGAGIVVNGTVITGCNAIGGEWGHNPLPGFNPSDGDNLSCYCGQSNCIETFLSGPGFAERFNAENECDFDSRQIIDQTTQGDLIAISAFERYCDQVARSLAGIINILDPEIIVLGGGMSNIAQLYDRVQALWGDYIFSDTINTQLSAARYGDSSGVRGAAWLWPEG